MIIKHTGIMFGIPCFVRLDQSGNIIPNKILPVSTVVASIEEGMITDEIAKEYDFNPDEIISIMKYYEEFGTY